ncbi:hypothetical protein SAMN02990966_06780 [Rhodospirillales bacterium URHD0017]|nr:hypothetical protein SAMN02990966_06780 [Rhodospirillales bacterium URHD0017]
MSRGIKLVLMGVAGAALLYSCAPTMMGGSGLFWLMPWLFRGAGVTAPATPGQTATKPTPGDTAPATTQSQRGGFGSTGGSGGSSGSS